MTNFKTMDKLFKKMSDIDMTLELSSLAHKKADWDLLQVEFWAHHDATCGKINDKYWYNQFCMFHDALKGE